MSYLLTTAALGASLNTTFAEFDMNVFTFFGNLQNDFLTVVAKIFTAMGETKYTIMIAVFALILLLFRKSRKYGLALVFAIIIGTLLTNIVLKPMVLRIRPYNTLQDVASYFNWYTGAGLLAESDYSFPSGHTTAATEIAVALCLCACSDRKWKLAWVPPVIAVLVGCSRVYLMVHYATDVLAGFIVGIIAGVIGFLLSRLILRRVPAFGNWKGIGRGITKAQASLACALVWLIIFVISFIPVISFGGDQVQRCSYDGAYKCYNEAQTGSKYPAIDGQYYCKIHWKEINGLNKKD